MKRIVVGCGCLIVVGVLVLGWAMFGDRSSFQTGLDSYEGLPHTASDITIGRTDVDTLTVVPDDMQNEKRITSTG